MGMLLNIPPRALEQVLYFASYIVLDPGTTSLEMHQLLSESEYQYVLTKYQADETGKPPFRVGIGAEAVREMLREIDLDELACAAAPGTGRSGRQVHGPRQRGPEAPAHCQAPGSGGGFPPERQQARVDDPGSVPVIPPELRPMVQLDGGRFATADLKRPLTAA